MWLSKYAFAFLLLGFVACKENKQATETSTDLGENPAAQDVVVDTANPAELTFAEEHWNFDTIAEGVAVEHAFKFTNTGKTPLVITNAYSSCGCTVPSYPVDPIKPRETGEIKVVFNSTNKQGRIFKNVTVLANTYPEDANGVSLGGVVKKK